MTENNNAGAKKGWHWRSKYSLLLVVVCLLGGMIFFGLRSGDSPTTAPSLDSSTTQNGVDDSTESPPPKIVIGGPIAPRRDTPASPPLSNSDEVSSPSLEMLKEFLQKPQRPESKTPVSEIDSGELEEDSADESPADETPTTQTGTIQQLESRISQLEAQVNALITERQFGGNVSALLLGFFDMEKLALSGKPFRDELENLLRDPALPENIHYRLLGLRDAANGGIPTIEDLKASFEQAILDFSNGVSADDSEGIWAGVKQNLSSLITVRKIGEEHAGMDDASIVARAEAHLNKGNLEYAVRELETLSSSATPFFSRWQTEADSRLDVERRLSRLRVRLHSATQIPESEG